MDRDGGSWWELDTLLAEACDSSISGITFSGGEPFLQAEALSGLAVRFREKGLSIVTYTGYTYEELKDMALNDPHVAGLLASTDLLVDGPYREAERDLSLAFRGSGNQRVIDLMKTRDVGEVVLSPLHFR
jgi:anaerobic ribonucleoside-triphosphate reductase activating protein